MKTTYISLVYFFFIQINLIQAKTISIGPGADFDTPNAFYNANVLQDGDTVLIQNDLYVGNEALCVWTKNNVVIKGVGGRPHMQANGSYIWGKGTWVFAGNDIVVENIEFSGAAVPDQNGAGIRLDGSGLTVRFCYFHHNENGILTSNPGTGDILIEYSEFAYNGYGDGQSHNLYIGRVGSLTFRFNYSHHAIIGHNLKSRAGINAILYNRMMDEDDGNSSYLMDLSNGGMSLVMGNLFMQSQYTDNCNLIAYGQEGFPAAYDKTLYFIHNTLVNRRSPGCSFISLNAASEGLVANNFLVGPGSLSSNPILNQTNVQILELANAGFLDETSFDYRISGNSPAYNAGSVLTNPPGFDLIPHASYLHPTASAVRSISGIPDVGAYELESVLALEEEEISESLNPKSGKLFPNPAGAIISLVDKDLYKPYYEITDIHGLTKKQGILSENLDIIDLPQGMYFIKLQRIKKGEIEVISFLKY